MDSGQLLLSWPEPVCSASGYNSMSPGFRSVLARGWHGMTVFDAGDSLLAKYARTVGHRRSTGTEPRTPPLGSACVGCPVVVSLGGQEADRSQTSPT